MSITSTCLWACAIAIVMSLSACGAQRPPDVQPADIRVKDQFRSDGSIHERKRYYLGPNGDEILHGLQEDWHTTGHLFWQTEMKHGKLDGLSKQWSIDGVLVQEGAWRQNRETGDWTWWQHTGDKMADCHYEDGRIVGSKRYWAQGVLTIENFYDDRGSLRQVIQYGGRGVKIFEGNYSQGVRHGAFTWWNADGTLRGTGEFRNGKPWEGTCGVLHAGSSGLEWFADYKNGRLVMRRDFWATMSPP